MKVYIYMGIFSDDAEPDLALFEDKQDCLEFLNKEVDKYCEEYNIDKIADADRGLNHWHFQTSDHEMTFSFMEVDVKQRTDIRFFNDNSFAEEVALNEEEIKLLDDLEYKIYKQAGYSKLSGGHCIVTVVDREDKEQNGDGLLLYLNIQVGVHGEHLSDYGSAVYDRETMNIEDD